MSVPVSAEELAPINLARREVENYLGTTFERPSSLNEFWCAKRLEYQRLFELYLRVAWLQLSNCSCERLFSKTGLDATHSRTQLANNRLQQVVYIYENFDICKVILDEFQDAVLETDSSDLFEEFEG